MFPLSPFLLLIAKVALSDYQDCGYHFNDNNVTFDLSELTLTEQSSRNYYNVTSGDYHYLFNFCADVMSPPSECVFNDKTANDNVWIDGWLVTRPDNMSSNVFQYTENYCFRLAGSSNEADVYNSSRNTLIDYRLIDRNDPSFGFIIHYYYGDYCNYWGTNREINIAFVCDPNIDNIPDKGEKVTEPQTCVYEIEVKSIYGCPLQCGRDSSGNLCSDRGVCGYDWDINTARCYCFAGFEGHYCNETAPFHGDLSWYEAVEVNYTSSYLYSFETIYGYNVTYDLQYIVDGYLLDSYYQLNDINTTHSYFLNIFDSLNPVIGSDSLSICTQNDASYDYGYIFQTVANAPGAPCYSLGRNPPTIELYDETLPTKGIKISYVNGDNSSLTSCADGRQANVYFICPDSDQHERIDTMNGLNDVFNNFKFKPDETGCVFDIEIFTVTACPYQCIVYDENRDMLSQCNAAGICAYDFSLDITRCICEHLEVRKPQDIQCYDANVTYAPTLNPTPRPTRDANVDIAWYQNVQISNTSNHIYQFKTLLGYGTGYNITYDLQYIVDGYLNGKHYALKDYRHLHDYYVNLFNKTVGQDAVKGICHNNIPDYDYGYIYQATHGYTLDKCFSLGRLGPYIQLYDEYRPALGIRISFEGGDKEDCYDSKRRRIDINFICPDDGGTFERYKGRIGLNDIYANYVVTEPANCEFAVDIVTSAACPAKCITYNAEKNAVSECTANGVCGYDNIFKLERCFCNNDMKISSAEDIFCANENITYAPSVSPTQSPTTQSPTYDPTLPPYIIWIDDIQPNNESDYIFQFETNFGYNVTYDLTYFVMGYVADKYYKLKDNDGHNVYFNLFNSTIINERANVEGICDANDANYSFGYIYQAHITDPNVECRSIGREGPNVQLYDEAQPTKGLRLSYENGDAEGCQARRSDINLVCPEDATEFEIYRSGSLNDRFDAMFAFAEPATCQYSITIKTSAVCPIQCQTYDEDKASISQCNTNGNCAYAGAVRCICNGNMRINDPQDIFCANDNITYSPTSDPSNEPSYIPTVNPTKQPTTNGPTNHPSVSPTTEEYSLFGEWARYNRELDLLLAFEVGVDLSCESVKFTFVSPGCDNMWFGIGIGGDYAYDDGEDDSDNDHGHASDDHGDEGSHSSAMNGYAMITFAGAIPDGYPQTYESTLEAGGFPQAQSSQDLRDCSTTIANCVQTSICYRDYAPADSEDFYKFMEGTNAMIWAFGNLDNDYLPMKHIDSSVSFIELLGPAECGYAQSVEGKADKGSKDGEIWMFVAIVLIAVLGVVGFILLCVCCYKRKNKNPVPHGYVHGRAQSTDELGTTQMITIDDNEDDDSSVEKHTLGNEDDDLL